jgi:hypothetical protein
MVLVRVRGPEEVLRAALAECKDAKLADDGVIADCDAATLKRLVLRFPEIMLESPP